MTLLVALQAFSEGFQGVFRSSERKRFCIHCFYMHVERLLGKKPLTVGVGQPLFGVFEVVFEGIAG